MKTYGFRYEIDYVVEADSEKEAIALLADLIEGNWMGYITEGQVTFLGSDEDEMDDSHF